MRLKIPLTTSNLTTWEDLRRFCSVYFQDIISLLNGKVDLVTNCSTQIIEVTFSGANATMGIQHTLGHVPQGFIPVKKSAAGDVYNGNQDNTTTTIYLQCSAAITVSVLIF